MGAMENAAGFQQRKDGEMRGWRCVMLCLLALAGCASANAARYHTYRLYRGSVTDSTMAIHVATFDAHENSPLGDYNKMNCEDAVKLYEGQPGVTVRYWCAKIR